MGLQCTFCLPSADPRYGYSYLKRDMKKREDGWKPGCGHIHSLTPTHPPTHPQIIHLFIFYELTYSFIYSHIHSLYLSKFFGYK